MYPSNLSTVSLAPDFPGAFPATPGWDKAGRSLDPPDPLPPLPPDHDIGRSPPEAAALVVEPIHVQASHTPDLVLGHKSSPKELPNEVERKRRPIIHTPSSIFTSCRAGAVLALPVDLCEPADDDTSDVYSPVSYEAPSTSRGDRTSTFTTSSYGYDSVSVASADVASTSRSNLSSFGCAYSIVGGHNITSVPIESPSHDSLSLSVDLLGLPQLHRPIESPAGVDPTAHDGVFFDDESSGFFNVDLSTLSQPGGHNWTLDLGFAPVPRDPSSSDDPSSRSTLSPLAAADSMEEESMTSMGTHLCPIDEDYPSECQEPQVWAHHRQPTAFTDFAPPFCDQRQSIDVERAEDLLPPGSIPTYPRAETTPLRRRRVFKTLIDDVKRLGKKVKKQISKKEKEKDAQKTEDAFLHSPLPPPRLAVVEEEYLNPSTMAPATGTNRTFGSQPLAPQVPFRRPMSIMDTPSIHLSLNSRPQTPTRDASFSNLLSAPPSANVKNIRRRTLPPTWSSEPFNPYSFPASVSTRYDPLVTERHARPTSVFEEPFNAGGVGRETLKPLNSYHPTSPLAQMQETRPSRHKRFSSYDAGIANELGQWNTCIQQRDSVQTERKSRWSTLFSLTKASRR